MSKQYFRTPPDGEVVAVQVAPQGPDTFRVQVGDGPPRHIRLGDVRGAAQLIWIDEQPYLGRVAQRGRAVYVTLGGVDIMLAVSRPRAAAQEPQAQDYDLTAPAPGQVVAVLAKPNDGVATGDIMFVLESMKMEIRVSAPRPGFVNRIHCAVGDTVVMGQLLAELDEED